MWDGRASGSVCHGMLKPEECKKPFVGCASIGYWNLSGGHLDREESVTDGSRLVTLKRFNY